MASKHLVVCVTCGTKFDANQGGYYNSHSRRYVCKACGKKQQAIKKKQIADERERLTGMRQTKGAMIAKLIIGAVFVCAGFGSPEGGWSIGYFLTAQACGLGMIAWGLVPFLKAKKKKQQEQNEHVEEINQQGNIIKTCPHCGATGSGSVCEYCGKAY